MKKNIMLGVNSKTNNCCRLSCLLPFDSLDPSEVEASDFVHYATNWCGQDAIERTLGFLKMKQTGRKIILNEEITFRGVDYDMGHEYSWKFGIDEIHELEEM
jgi:hypothetical protein